MINSVFAMQGLGQFGAGMALLITTVGFKQGLETAPTPAACSTTYACVSAVDKIWRIIIGFGAVPACVALYFRLTIPETPRYTFDVSRSVREVAADIEAVHHADGHRLEKKTEKASWREFGTHYRKWKNLKILLGAALSWFFLVRPSAARVEARLTRDRISPSTDSASITRSSSTPSAGPAARTSTRSCTRRP